MTESEFDQQQNSPSVEELPSSEDSESVEVVETPEQPEEIESPNEVSPNTTPTVEIIDLDTPEIEENIDNEANEPERKYVEEVEDYYPETFTEETTPSTAPSPIRSNSNGGNEGLV